MKHLFSFLLLSCFLLLSSEVASQEARTLSFSIMDKYSGEPVEGAFVFFSESSTGSVSDTDGLLEISMQAYTELVISHLNYETRVLMPDSVALLNNTTVLLSPRALRMKEVTVKLSDKFAKKRKKRLARFERAFLGDRRERKGVRILNPEDILFEEVATGLRAEVLQPIKIKNDALGYAVSFLLDTFLLTKQSEVFYGGKVFFKDLQTTRQVPSPNWDAAREKRFLASKTHFFRALRLENSDLDQYEIGQSSFNGELEFIKNRKMDVSELQWKRGANLDTLLFTGFLSIVNRKIITKWGRQTELKVARDEYATSFLRSRTGRFILSHSGILINNREVEELGYWSEQRVAGLLPTDYRDKPPVPQSATASKYLDSLAAFRQVHPQEKVYLHLDKPYYSTNNDIWFKAYLLDASSHRQGTSSKVMHVELVDPDGNIASSLRLHQDQSLSGRFKLNPNSKTGIYHIRAYTDYMRNLDAAYFFQRAFSVYDPRGSGVEKLTRLHPGPTVAASEAGQKRPVNLQVFPEGGHLIGGLENNLVLHLSDSTGMPLSFSGTITDASGKQLDDWKTNHDGWGGLRFTPTQGSSYWANIIYQANTFRIPLPNTAEAGMTLQVNNEEDREVLLNIGASPGLSTEGAFLIGHVRGQVFSRLERLQPGEDITFFRSQIPTGVACFSLFDKEGQLRSTRLFFNDFTSEYSDLQVRAPFAFFRPRQKIELEISWADSLDSQGASLSATVTDRALIRHDQEQVNIKDYLLLNSDLRTPVSKPDTSLLSPGQRTRILLDQQLTASDWGRFEWAALVGEAPKTVPFIPVTSASIKGYVTKKGKSGERVKAEVLLTSLHPQPIILKQITDDDGMFEFTDLPYLDTVDYVLQAALFDPQRSTDELKLTSKKRKVVVSLEERQSPEVSKTRQWKSQGVNLPADVTEKLFANERKTSHLDSLYNPDWQIDLDEVTVRSKKVSDSRNVDVFNLNQLDWIDPNQPADGLLSTLRPSHNYIRNSASGELVAEFFNGQGQKVHVPVTIYINGLPSSYTLFQRLRADMIDFISIERAFLNVTTRSSPRSQKAKVQDGLFFTTQNGFYRGQVFPAPDYSMPQPGDEREDLRTTIHWAPELRLNEEGKTILSFYAADTPTEYEVRIEGVSDAGEPVFATYLLTISE